MKKYLILSHPIAARCYFDIEQDNFSHYIGYTILFCGTMLECMQWIELDVNKILTN